MSKVFGFNEDELKLLLVAVRQMRRTFTSAMKAESGTELAAYVKMYDDLYAKLLDMTGPIPGSVGDLL